MKRSYDVEKILGHHAIEGDGTIYYRVKWKNFPEEKATWEPFRNVDGCSALVEYELERERVKRNKDISDFVHLLHFRFGHTDSGVGVNQNAPAAPAAPADDEPEDALIDEPDVEPPEIAFMAVNGVPKIEPVDDFDVAVDEVIQPE